VSLPAQAITATLPAGTTVTAIPAEIPLTAGAPTLIGAGPSFTQSFTFPAGASFTDVMLVATNAGGNMPANIVVQGNTTGVDYVYPPTAFTQFEYFTFPFSPTLDPAGFTLTATISNLAIGSPMTFAAVGLVYPTTVRALIGGAVPISGPTGVVGGSTATPSAQVNLGLGGSLTRVVRIWTTWITGTGVNTSVTITCGGVFIARADMGSNGAGNSSVSYPGGLPFSTGGNAFSLNNGAGGVVGNMAYSIDVP
jgi:hypothetical protein